MVSPLLLARLAALEVGLLTRRANFSSPTWRHWKWASPAPCFVLTELAAVCQPPDGGAEGDSFKTSGVFFGPPLPKKPTGFKKNHSAMPFLHTGGLCAYLMTPSSHHCRFCFPCFPREALFLLAPSFSMQFSPQKMDCLESTLDFPLSSFYVCYPSDPM